MQVYLGARDGDAGTLLSRDDRFHDCCIKGAVYLKVVVRQGRITVADGAAGLLNAQEDIGVLLVRWPLALIQVSRGGVPGGNDDLSVSTAPDGDGDGVAAVEVEERKITASGRASRGKCDYEDGCCYTYSEHLSVLHPGNPR